MYRIRIFVHKAFFTLCLHGVGNFEVSFCPTFDRNTHAFSRVSWFRVMNTGKMTGIIKCSPNTCFLLHLIYNSLKMHAEYGESHQYVSHRLVQSYQLSQFIQHLTQPTDTVIVCGDMNCKPSELCYRIIKDVTGLVDAWGKHGQVKVCFCVTKILKLVQDQSFPGISFVIWWGILRLCFMLNIFSLFAAPC